MKVYQGIESWNCGVTGRTVASLGNFDGVHLGHRAILQRVTATSTAESLPSVTLTFDPIPRKVLHPETAPLLIQTMPQRLRSLGDLDIDHTIVIVFDRKFSQKTPLEFVSEILVRCLRIRHFVVGQNFAFGHQKRGNIELLRQLGRQHDFDVEEVPQVEVDGNRVSSTLIRDLVLAGKVEDANRYLGHTFRLAGKVVPGEKLGGKIGIPTANLKVENELLPAKGVYVSKVIVGSHSYRAVTNVGIRPTVGGQKLTVESHLLDFSQDLYGQEVEFEFLQKLRQEMRFDGIEQLKTQIKKDVERAKEYFVSLSFGKSGN
jgi:riboflavin kinase / FMN adenylyltransferase